MTGAATTARSGRTLVAGVGNIFRSDDGFGSEVAQRLAAEDLPAGVRVVDYGIRSTHLAYDLLDGWERLVLVDLVPPAGRPGTLHLLEVDPGDAPADDSPPGAVDPHSMDPGAVLSGVVSLGGTLPPTVVVGCEPATVDDGIGLSPAVAGAVPGAVRAVLDLVNADVPATAGGGS